ncbi:MAG TPA: flagellar export chaperone FliS [Stenotrophobium sp.]|jgi:flagellar protein FliS|nr:flagellar export chaperone FliS [Stenotrophobium sp.]
MQAHAHSALRQYQSAAISGEASDAHPHKLIEMLLAGALDRIARARGHVERSELAYKHKAIGSVVAILDHLRMSLDLKAGGEIARNLGSLYDYCMQRMAQANATDDVALLDEVSGLLREIKSAWDAIAPGAARAH